LIGVEDGELEVLVRRFTTRVALAGLMLVAAATPASAGFATAPSPRAQAAARYAVQEVGAPYSYGGDTLATGFDSSGLVVWAFDKAGHRGLPHSTQALSTRGTPIARTRLERGDLVFFDNAAHVGMYIGHGEFVHAKATGLGVRIGRLTGSYERYFSGAVRID
jgi:cell wall-associated NlpC family hydrolase